MKSYNNLAVSATEAQLSKTKRPKPREIVSTLSEFLKPFFPSDRELVCIRALPPKGALPGSGNHVEMIYTTREQIDGEFMNKKLTALNKNHGLFFVVNAGGDKNADIKRINAYCFESDTTSIEDQHARLDASPLTSSARVVTFRSVQGYFFPAHGEIITPEEGMEVQRGLIAYFGSDSSITKPAQLMRLPFFDHIRIDENGEFAYKRVELHTFEPERRYTLAEMRAAFPDPFARIKSSGNRLIARVGKPSYALPETISPGSRNVSLAALAGGYRNMGHSADDIERLLQVSNSNPVLMPEPLPDHEIKAIAKSIGRYETDGELPIEKGKGQVFRAMRRDAMRTTTHPVHNDTIYGLARGELALLNALPDGQKTTLMRSLILSMACGRPYIPLFDGGKGPIRCGHLDAETDVSRSNDDLTAMEKDGDFTTDEKRLIGKNLFVMNSLPEDETGATLFLSNPRGMAMLSETITTNRIEFLVIDTLSACFMVTEENSSGAMNGEVIQPLRKLARDTGCSILLLHHIGKNNEGSGSSQPGLYAGRGSSALGCNVPAVYKLDSPQGRRDEDQRVTLRFAKCKRPYREDAVMKKSAGSRWFSATSEEPVSSRTVVLNRVAELAAVGLNNKAELVAAIVSAGVAKQSKAYELIKDALKEGRIIKTASGFSKPSD